MELLGGGEHAGPRFGADRRAVVERARDRRLRNAGQRSDVEGGRPPLHCLPSGQVKPAEYVCIAAGPVPHAETSDIPDTSGEGVRAQQEVVAAAKAVDQGDTSMMHQVFALASGCRSEPARACTELWRRRRAPNRSGATDRSRRRPGRRRAASATRPAGTTAAPTKPTPPRATIVVTGFRAALQNAVNTKKRSDLIVESISAEDIGKLPDASIAELISRLPGLTSQRLSGRSNVISIRGFSPDFSTTLLNGREQTSTGDNRAVEYDQYPSEIINQVNVYKTPMASLIGQGLSGTVDLRTIRPLDVSKRIISVGARGVFNDLDKLNPDVDRYGWRVNGMFVDQFADDTVGIALAATYLNEPFQIEEFNSWGYAPTGPGGTAPFVIGGSKSYNTSTDLKRLGLMGTLAVPPDAELHLDARRLLFELQGRFDQARHRASAVLGRRPILLPNYTSQTARPDHSGQFDDVKGVVRNDVFQRHAKLYAFGWNNEWHSDDGWRAALDIGLLENRPQRADARKQCGHRPRLGVGATRHDRFQQRKRRHHVHATRSTIPTTTDPADLAARLGRHADRERRNERSSVARTAITTTASSTINCGRSAATSRKDFDD